MVRLLREQLPRERVFQILAEAGTLQEAQRAVMTLAEAELVTVAEASQRTGVPIDTIRSWRMRGHLRYNSRLPKSPGRGGTALVDLAEVQRLKDHPPKIGRPRKDELKPP